MTDWNKDIDDTPLFIAEGSFELKGLGTVYTGKCPADFRNRERSRGFDVIFNGTKRKIKALESFAKLDGPRVGEQVGLVFEEEIK